MPRRGAGVTLTVACVTAVSPHRVLLELEVPSQIASRGASRGSRVPSPLAFSSVPWTPQLLTKTDSCTVTCTTGQTLAARGPDQWERPRLPLSPQEVREHVPLGLLWGHRSETLSPVPPGL